MFFRKRDPQQPSTTWLKWVMVAFVLYALFMHQQPDTPENPNEFRKTFNKAAGELKPSNLINLKEYQEKIFPSYAGTLRIKDTALGTGLPAVCGQEASVAYAVFLPDERPLDDFASTEKPMRFIIGEHKVMPVFEQGVIGMQPGGARSVLVPPSLAYGHENFKREDTPKTDLMRFEIALLSVSPELPNPDSVPYRIAQTRQGSGNVILCGTPMKAHITVWAMDGKKMYDSRDNNGQPVAFTPGLSEVFVGLEQGVVGMRVGEARTLIVPPTFQKPLRKPAPDIAIPLPANQTVLVDVDAVQ